MQSNHKRTNAGSGCFVLSAICAAVLISIPGVARSQNASNQYVDKYIQSSTLSIVDLRTQDAASGNPLSIRVEAFREQYESADYSLSGFSLYGSTHTLTHGSFEVDLRRSYAQNPFNLRNGSDGTRLTLSQRSLALTSRIEADHSMGYVERRSYDLTSIPFSRFDYSEYALEGLAGWWKIDSGAISVSAAHGQEVQNSRIFLASDDGWNKAKNSRVSTVWLQEPLAKSVGAFAAVRLERRKLENNALVGQDGLRVQFSSGYSTVPWSFRVNYSLMRADRVEPVNSFWSDAGFSSGAIKYITGFYRLGNEQGWNYSPNISPLSGAYARFSYSGAVHSFDSYLESFSREKDSVRSLLSSLNYRRTFGSKGSFSSGAYIRSGVVDSWLIFSERRFASQDGGYGLRVEASRISDLSKEYKLSADRDISIDALSSLHGGIYLGKRLEKARTSENTDVGSKKALYGASITGSIDFWRRSQLSGSMSFDAVGKDHSINSALSLDWEVFHGGRLGLTWRSGASRTQENVFASPRDIQPNTYQTRLQRSNSLFLSFVYEKNTGSMPQAAGLFSRSSQGVGSISGIVFADENSNGRKDPEEKAIPNAVVFLDSRWTSKTDAAGRFSFPAVYSGKHNIGVTVESLPIQWEPHESYLATEVAPRKDSFLSLAVVRIGAPKLTK